MAFNGMASRGKDGQLIADRFRFIGPQGASSDVIVRLVDERLGPDEITITRHLTKDTCTIKFDAPPRYEIDDAWLKGLLSVAFMSAKNFGQLSGTDQAKLLGIDTSEYDLELAELKKDFTIKNARVRSFGTIEPVEKVEKVNTYELNQEKERISKHNQRQKENKEEIEAQHVHIANCEATVAGLMEQLKEAQETLKGSKKFLSGMPKPEVLIDITPIEDKIATADETNDKARDYETYAFKVDELDDAKNELAKNKEEQKTVIDKRVKYVKDFDFGFKGLTVGEDGGLLLNDNPVNLTYLSNGELESVVVKFRKYTQPKLKSIIIDDADLVDDVKMQALVEELLKDGYQVILSKVGDKPQGKNSIVLRECKLAGEKEEGEDLL